MAKWDSWVVMVLSEVSRASGMSQAIADHAADEGARRCAADVVALLESARDRILAAAKEGDERGR